MKLSVNQPIYRRRQFGIIGMFLIWLVGSSSATAMNSFVSQVSGEGQPIILIPGLMSNGTVWDEISQQLSKSSQVHVISIAGFAGTPAIKNQSLASVKTDLINYIEKHQLNKPVVIGHSLGGFMALWLASSHPETIGNVISVDGLPFIGPIFTRSNSSTVESLASQADMIQGMYHKMSQQQLAAQTKQGIYIQATSSENQARIIQMAAQSDPVTVGNAIHELLSTDIRKDMATINSKSLLIGASGAFTTKEQHQSVKSLYHEQISNAANVELIMNTNDRHFIMLDNPNWLISQIQSFLSENNQ